VSLHDFLQRDPACRALVEGALAATAPLLAEEAPEPLMAELDGWAMTLAGRMPLPWNFHQALDELNRFLFLERGLKGDLTSYEDPRNALLPEVVRRRKGLPISLGILWIELARRLGFDAVGVALPGHFICGVRHDLGLLCFDPFDQGAPVGIEGARELVTRATGGRVPFHLDMMTPCSDRAILARLVRNLHARFLQAEVWEEVLWTSTHLILLEPGDPEPWRARAQVHLHHGNPEAAEADLREAQRLMP
jgi:regulator of sirC expression with transglutaminase-like and TPR domain